MESHYIQESVIRTLPLYTGLELANGLTKRLFSVLPINSFYHMLVYPDNSWVGLTTDITWMDDCFFSEKQYFYCELACPFEELFSTYIAGHVSILLNIWHAPTELVNGYIKYFMDRGKQYIIGICNKQDNYHETLFFTMHSMQDFTCVLSQYDKLMLLVEEMKYSIAADKEVRLFYQNERVFSEQFKQKDFYNIHKVFKYPDGVITQPLKDKLFLHSTENDFFVTKQEALCMEKVNLNCLSSKEAAKELNISHRTVQNHLNNVRNRLRGKSNYTEMLKKIVCLDSPLKV